MSESQSVFRVIFCSTDIYVLKFSMKGGTYLGLAVSRGDRSHSCSLSLEATPTLTRYEYGSTRQAQKCFPFVIPTSPMM